MRDINHEAAKI